MRKITAEACRAFNAGQPYHNGNTTVKPCLLDGLPSYSLHGNQIAEKRADGLYITLAGWNTATTRERLNGLDGVKINTKDGHAYLNGQKWNGKLIKLTTKKMPACDCYTCQK